MIDPLPRLVWDQSPPPAIEHIEPLGEGDFCTSYLVNGTDVVRLARHAEASASLRREMLLLPQLEAMVDISIPRIRGAGIQAGTEEQFVFYPLVPGTIIDAEILHALDPSCRSSLMQQLARFVAQLHSFPVERARACGLEERDPRRYLPELVDRAESVLAHDLEERGRRECRELVELYLSSPELHRYTPVLLHGDLSPDHILGDVARCALTGVIDFGDCMIGDPCWDLIYILEDYGDDLLDLFLSFYAPHEKATATRRIRIFQQLNDLEYLMQRIGRAGNCDQRFEPLP